MMAEYTKRHMENFRSYGFSRQPFGYRISVQAARQRLKNAGSRMGARIVTRKRRLEVIGTVAGYFQKELSL